MNRFRQNDCGEKLYVTRHRSKDRKGADRLDRSIERRSRQQGKRECRNWSDEDVKIRT